MDEDSLECEIDRSWYISIIGYISFFTIVPIKIYSLIEDMAEYSWVLPFIGTFIGVFVGGLGYLIGDLLALPTILVAGITYAFSLWFQGFHHLDGLMDLGDGLMAHGTPERKLEIIRDINIGTGGISLFVIIALISFGAIASLPVGLIGISLLITEISSKMGLMAACSVSTSAPNGTGRFFIKKIDMKYLILTLIPVTLLSYILFGIMGTIGIIAGTIAGLILAIIVKKDIKYATGDLLGASNEIAKATTLVTIIIYLKMTQII